MTTEKSIDNETWSTVTEQTILLQDGLKFVADLVSVPEFDSNSLSIFIDCEFRFERSWIAKLAQRLQAALCMKNSPYQLFFDFRQRTIIGLWLSQRKRLKACKNGEGKEEASKTTVEKRKPVSFSSHVSLLLLLPLLESQSKIDPSLPISCTEVLLHCLRECTPYSLCLEPRSSLDGLERLLCSWLTTETSKQSQSAEGQVSTSRKEDIVAALIALACGRLSIQSLIQVILILEKHKTSLHNISTHQVLQRTLAYTRTGKHTLPAVLKTSNFNSRWHCKPFNDLASNQSNDDKCASIASDGKFLYIACSTGKGLAKIGTGRMGTLRGLLYDVNSSIDLGWVAWNHGFLLFRPAAFDSNGNIFCFVLDPSTLKIKCNIEFKDPARISIKHQVGQQVSTLQFTGDGVHLYWIFTLSNMTTDQPQESQLDQFAHDLCIWEFKLEEVKDTEAMSARKVAVPVTPQHMIIDLRKVDENYKSVHQSDATSAGQKQPAQTPMNIQFNISNFGLARNNLCKIPMFVASDMLILVLPHYSVTSAKGAMALRAKKNPINCCFSLVDDSCVIRENLIDIDDSSWLDFGIARLGVCCDPMNGVIWTYGDSHVCEWSNTGFPCMNQVKDQLTVTNDPFGPSEGDQMDITNVLSSTAIQITILSRTLDAQLSAHHQMSPDSLTGALLDSSYLILIYEALHLGIVSKNHSIILSLLHVLQPLLQVAVTRRVKLENQVVKDLRSLVWMLVCASSESYSRQIQRQACKVFVRGLNVFYTGSKEQSALLMVLLSESDSASNGIYLMREMLLRDMAAKLADTEESVKPPNKLAYDAECKLIKTCVMESTTDILQCVSLTGDDLAEFLAVQPDVSASLQYISTLVMKIWRELLLSDDYQETSLAEVSGFITRNVESIMFANKMFEASHELLEVVLEALQKLQNDSSYEIVQTRLDGLEKVIRASPIGQLLLFLVTIMANAKFCNLPLAKGLLSRVTTTTITATKAANLFHHIRTAANTKPEVSVPMPTLQSSLPQLTPWTHSCTVESIHPVRDDYRYTKTVTFKGANCLYLKFDPRCATQYEYDKVMVYAGPNTTAAKVGEFGGNAHGYGSKGVVRLGWPKDFITVEGDSVTFVFQVKSTRERTTPDKAVWGFACSVSIKKESSEDEDITLPVLTDVALGLSHLNYNLLGVLYDGPATINEEETCSHLLNSQLLQRCIWEKSEGVFLQETQASGIKITITHDEDQTPSTTPKALPRQTLSTELTAKLRNASGIRAPTIRPSIRQALEPETIEEVILSAVIRHLNLYDTVRGLELLKVANADSSEYVRLCEIMREVFRRIDGVLRQLQAMAEVELRWSQEIEDLRQGLLQPSAAFFNEYHLQEVKSKDLELLCSLKGILFDPMEQEHVVGKLIELLENEAQSSTNHDSDDLLPRMPKTRALRHSIMECGELLCSVTIQSPFKKRGTPGRSVSHSSFLPRIPGHEHQVAETSSVNRSFSAPSQLHRSMSVREGAQDLRRLQRWRTAIQKKKQPHGLGTKPGAKENNMEFASILDDIFTFIGSDPDKEVSYSSFLSAARLRNERGLSRVQALLHMHELIGVCSSMPGHVPELMITIASVLSQGPRIEELKCGGMVTRVQEEFTNVVQALLQQASTDPIIYSNSILVLSVCPFSWQEERCVIRSGLISLLDKLCSLGRDQSQSSRNTASMAWASFQVLLDRFVQWENDIGYQAGEIEWSGLAYQVSSLITNYLDLVMEESRQESTKARDSLQYILKLLQSIAGSKMGEAILQQSCTVFTLFAMLLDPQAPPKLVLTVLKLCRAALPLMTTNSCEQLTLPVTAEQYLNRDGNATDLKPVLKVAKLLLVKLGGFISPCIQSGKRLQYGKNSGNEEKGGEESANGSEKTGQYIVYVHKRSEQPSHEVVQKIMSETGQRFVFRAGLGTEIDRAVRLDHELTENNKAVIMTDVFNACVTKASSLAAIGLVTSVLPAYHRQQEPTDKGLVSSENVCSVRNQILASQSCHPFVSGQVAHTMASEVISLLQSLLTSPFSDTAFLWASAVRQVLSDTLNSVPSLMEHLGEEIERLIMWQGQETEEDEDKLTVVNEELMLVSGQVMAALCTMGGFNHTVYAGCNAKIVGEDMIPMTCEVLGVSDGMATVLRNDTTTEGSTQKDRKLELPLVRLELPHKEPVSLNKLELVEQAIEALHLILTTRDVTFPRMSESQDSNTLLLNTSAARVLCELKTRASMVLACQMKDPMFCNTYTSHPSRPLQTIKSLADMTDPGRRLPVLDSQCQELRKLFKDLVKPVHRRHHGKTKTVVLDIGKEHPPLKGVVFTEGYRVAHMLIEGENVPNMPRGAYLYATQSIPIKAPSYYWEVEVLSLGRRDAASYVGSGSSFSVGIAPTVSRPADKWATPVGACVLHDNGIAVHYRRGGFTNWETTNTGLVLKDSHVIGCSYTRSNDDVDYGSVYFTHNGQQLPGLLHGVRAGLWPVVHLHRKDVKVRVNFGSQPFVYAKGSKIRQAADLASDSMEEVRQLLLELPFAGVENDSDEEAKVKPSSEGVAAAKIKKIPEPLSLSSDTDIREYDPSASLNCMLSSSCDVMTDTGPLSHMEEDDSHKKIVDSENASPTELLVKAWEEKVFPVIRRRFRNEADRRSGLDQIRGALQAGMMDIAVATLEDLYEDSGGIPNTLTLPRLEDVKEDANKLSARNIKQGMAVVVSSKLNDASVAPAFAVPDVKRTYGLTGIVLTIDKPHNIAEVETYNREEGNLMRFWYPISALERPTSGLSRSSFLAMRAGDTTLTEALQELLTCEKEITRLYCQEALIEAMETSGSLQFDTQEDSEVTLLKSLSRHHLLGPYTDGSSAPTLNTVSSLRCCLSLGHVLPSVMFYTDPARIISKVNQLLNDKASSGEDEVVRLTDSVCHGLRDSSKLLWHREFVVSHEALEEEIHFPQTAITVLTCRSNPLIHTGWMNGKKPFVTVLCYYGGAKLSKTGKVAKYKAVQYPNVADENTNYWAEKYPVKILATNRVVVRYEDHATEGPVVDLYALSPDLLLGLVFIETFVQRVSNHLDCEDFTNQTNELPENTLISKTVIFNVIELVSTFLLRTKLPSVVKEVVFHLLAQLLRISHRVESMTSSFPSQAHTSQLTLILTRLMPLKTELQKLLDKEVSATNEVALEFILRGDFENNKFVSYLQALFEVVLAMAEVTPLTRDQGGYRRSRQGSLTDGMLQGDSAQNSPSSTASSPFDFKPEDSTTSASVTGSGTTVIPQTPPWSSRARRKGSLRKRKRAHVHEVVSPTESMPWFDNVLASILVLRHLIQGSEAWSVHALYDSLSSVVAIKASVTQRLLVITNIPKTMSKDEAISAIEKACRPCGGIFKECTYLPEIRYQDSNSHGQQDNGGEGLHHLTKLLPSAQCHKPDKIFGYAVVELRNSSQTDLARQAISSSKSFKESSTSREDPIGVAKVITDLLMDGTNELEAFAVFDEFLERKLYDDANQLKASALDVLGEIFRSCGTSVVLSDFDRDTPPQPLSRRGSVLMTRLHLSGTKSPDIQEREERTSSNVALLEKHENFTQAPGTACANDDKEDGGSLVTSTPRGIGKQNFENSLESDPAQHLGPSYLDLGVIQEATSIHDGRCDSPASCFAQSRRASEERAYTPILEFSFADGKYPSLPEDDTPSRSLNLQRLSEENICHSSFSNLLAVFFQTFCHGKKSLQEQVRQVLRDHGMTSEESSDSYLTLDGLIEWVRSKCVDSVRGIWKAILACGYDLDFKRSTYIFPHEVLEDHKNWSMAKDKLLVSFVNDQCRAISTSPSRLMPDEINMVEDDLVSEQYNQLQGIPLLSVRSRFAFLKSLNQTMEKLLLPMSDLRVADTHHLSTAALLKQASGFMFYDIKMAFLKRMLDHSDHRGSSPMSPEISLDPLETLEADKVSSSGPQFFQAARYLSTVSSAGLRVKVATGGDPTFPLRVQLRGEQVLGSGGSFRHFMWLMARELQGQHVNLLIPCPSTAANRNKGMLILKPGKMTYSEEKSLIFFGQLLGIALRSDIPFAVDLMPAFWKSLLVLPIDPKNDLHDTDILTYNYIRRFSEVQSREEFTTLCYEADLCPYRFVYTSLNGEEVELCPEGANKPVTWENHRLYVDAIRELRLKELRCTSRMAAIRCGLYSVVPPHALSVMLPSDLQIRTCGLPTVDLDFLKAHTTYVAGIKETDAHIEFFWNALESFSQDQLRKFVKFACNQERLPSTCTCQKGHPSTVDVHVPPYPMKIGPPDGTGRSDVRYIRVETCMFMVKLPRYSTQEITTQKLLYAINCREDPLTDI